MKYTTTFKKAVLRKVLPPENRSVHSVSMELGVGEMSIHRWLSQVKVLYDQNFEGKKVIIHPLRNTASISISFEDLKRFTEHFGHTWQPGDVYKNEGTVQ